MAGHPRSASVLVKILAWAYGGVDSRALGNGRRKQSKDEGSNPQHILNSTGSRSNATVYGTPREGRARVRLAGEKAIKRKGASGFRECFSLESGSGCLAPLS